MALTFGIGAQTFLALAGYTTGRYALAFEPKSGTFEILRTHVKGVNGNYLVRCGEAGRQINCKGRYIDTLANIESNFYSDYTTWENTAVSVTFNGRTFARCSLEPGGSMILRNPVALGRSSLAFMDCQFSFICDGGVS